MKPKIKLAVMLVAISLAGFSSEVAKTGQSDSICVIVNNSNPVDSMKKHEVNLIYKGIKRKWKNGKNIAPVNLPHGTELRTKFDGFILNMSPSEVIEYWDRQRVRAAARSPRKLVSHTAVKLYVSENKQAIGYLPQSDIDDTVKVVYAFTP